MRKESLIAKLHDSTDQDQGYRLLMTAILNLKSLNSKGKFIPIVRPPPDDHTRELTRMRVMRLRARRKEIERRIVEICEAVRPGCSTSSHESDENRKAPPH